MSIHRFFRRQFPLRSRTRGIAFLCFILLMSGCGGEESVDKPVVESVRDEKSINDVPIAIPYYPMTVGNRWVYRNPDGSEWSREVAQSESILHETYHAFSYHPPLADTHPMFIKSPTYVVAADGIFLQAKLNDINDAIRQTVLRSNQDKPLNWETSQSIENGVYTLEKRPEDALVLLFFYKIKATEYTDFTLLHLPPNYPERNKVLQMTIRGERKEMFEFHVHEVEAKVNIWQSTSFAPVLTTPAGRFENCLKIVYGTEINPLETLELVTVEVGPAVPAGGLKGYGEHLEHEISKELAVLVPMLKYTLNLQTIWLAPGVGPVKIETPNGIAELIDYEIKTVPSSQ